MQQKNQSKRKPLGSAILWTDEDLADLARISQADLKAAQALWRNAAPTPLQGIVDAQMQQAGHNNGIINRF